MKIKDLLPITKSFLRFQCGVAIGYALRMAFGPSVGLLAVVGVISAWLAFGYWRESKRSDQED